MKYDDSPTLYPLNKLKVFCYKMRRALFLGVLLILILTLESYACFDTYLFLKRSSMVYPYRSLVLETNGEYSFFLKDPNSDMFLSFGNIYYGLMRNFSVQFSLGSGEKERNQFKLDSYGVRGVYNVYTATSRAFTVDLILEHRGMFTEKANEIEFSVPAIFYSKNYAYVIHPTVNYGIDSKELEAG